jgi:hypothetical protein
VPADASAHPTSYAFCLSAIIFASLVFLLGGGGTAREEPARGVGTVHVPGWGGGGSWQKDATFSSPITTR